MSKKSYILFDGGHRNSSKNKLSFYAEGSSPNILRGILDFINEKKNNLEEVNICLCLFNNFILANELLKLTRQKIKVNIISIPLSGYDTKESSNEGFNSYFTNKPLFYVGDSRSKYDFAQRVYNNFSSESNTNKFLKFSVFEHIYVRSLNAKKFSKGNIPFSLNSKNIYLKMKNGSSYSILISSDLALRERKKEELCLFLENNEEDKVNNELFFKELYGLSTPLEKLDDSREYFDYTDNFAYQAKKTPLDHNHLRTFFTAPFLYDSNKKIEQRIIEKISNAKERVIICTQHLNTFDGSLKTALGKSKTGLRIKILTQTYCDSTLKTVINKNKLPESYVSINGESYKVRTPENSKSFMDFIKRLKRDVQCKYYFNPNVNLNFMVVDNDVDNIYR
ncbi:hypothetical protein ACPV54_25570 [Vibrio mediterranei]